MYYGRRYYRPLWSSGSLHRKDFKASFKYREVEKSIVRVRASVEQLKLWFKRWKPKKKPKMRARGLKCFFFGNKSLFEAKREEYFEIQEKQRSRGFIEKALFTNGNEIQMEKKDLGKLRKVWICIQNISHKNLHQTELCYDCKFRK